MTDGPLDHRAVGRLWDATAPAWTRLARAGYDVYRDHLNTPALLAMLPNVDGLAGLDIGCGEGHNTRLLAGRGAAMTAIDISPRFIRAARELEDAEPLGIRYQVASAVALPFPDDSFDFTTAFMSLQDVPETEAALAEAARVLKRGGFLQFSICHPCSDTPHRRPLKDEQGREYAVEIGRYFEEEDPEIVEWLFSSAPPEAKTGMPPFRLPRIHRTLSRWLNAIVEAGFCLERAAEPSIDDDFARPCPTIEDTRVVPYFLHLRCRRG